MGPCSGLNVLLSSEWAFSEPAWAGTCRGTGAAVVFIDAGQPGEGVTNWSFSWVNASNKTERRSYFDLNVASMAAYRELAGTIGPGSWWHPSGHLRWAGDSAAEAKLLETAELLAGWDYRVEVYTGAEVRRRLDPLSRCPARIRSCSTPTKHGCTDGISSTAWSAEPLQSAPTPFPHRVFDIGTAADGASRTVTLSDRAVSTSTPS